MHKRLVAHILLLAVMFMVAAFSGNVTAASGTYNDPLGRFSVGIPTGWILNRTYPDGFTVLFAKGTERFEIQTAEMTQTDPIAKAKMFFGANSPTVFNTGADGLLYTAYSESGRSFYCVFVFQDNIGFMLRHSAPLAYSRETVARQWLVGFNAAANASTAPAGALLMVEPVWYKIRARLHSYADFGCQPPHETIGTCLYNNFCGAG